MGRVPGAVYGQVFFRDSEACQGSRVPRAEEEEEEEALGQDTMPRQGTKLGNLA